MSMEIIILKKNEIVPELFQNQKIYEYTEITKNEEYGNYIELDETKCKIDLLDKICDTLSISFSLSFDGLLNVELDILYIY